MREDYPDGSFRLSWQHGRAVFHADGTLKFAEYKRKHYGKVTYVTVAQRHTKVREWLQRQGLLEAKLLNDGIFKRRPV